jgi:acid phosphatase type 7
MTTARFFTHGRALLVVVLTIVACGSRELASPTGPTALNGGLVPSARDGAPVPDVVDPDVPPAPSFERPAVVIGAGDLAQCGLEGVVRTGRLLNSLLRQMPDATAITLGDNSNDDGSVQRYECFDRWWGSFRHILFPVPGNHDYQADELNPYYYEYFANKGAKGLGYYSYDRGSWHIVALNSELPDGLRAGQLAWLESDLRLHPSQCSLAYFHRPLFSSGQFAALRMKRLWDVLSKHGVDVIANGHEHFFASFPLLDGDGRRDERFGIRQIIAGTGGARLFATPAARYGETIVGQTWGLLKLSLGAGTYQWDFISVDEAVLDHGEGQCHPNPM